MEKEKKLEKLPFVFAPLWASKSISVGISALLIMQFTFYATETVGLSVGVIGTIIFLTKLLDAAIGVVVGFIVEKTNTRFGKGRFYDLFLIPMWLCIILIFSTPNFDMIGKIIYAFTFYALANAVFTALVNGGELAYMGRAIQNDHHRAQVTSVAGLLVMLVCTGGAILLPQLMASWGKEPGGWQLIAFVYAIPMCIIGMLRFFTIKEKPIESENTTQEKTIGIREGLNLIFNNKYVFVLAPAALLCNLTQTISVIVATYYFTYVIGNLGLMSFVSMLGLLAPLVLLLFPIALRTIGGMNFVRIGLMLASVGNLLKLIDLNSLPLLIASQLLANTGLSVFLMMQGYFVLQVIDYGEKKHGRRIDGLSSAVNGLYGKIGAGFASLLIGGLMGLAGYVNLSSQQSETAISAIIALYSWIPSILCVLILVTIHFYNLEKKMDKNKREE